MVSAARTAAWRGAFLPLLATLGVALSSPSRADLPQTIDRVKASIVAVGTYQRTRSPAFRFSGTGFAIADGTMVATNAHVVPAILDPDQIEKLVVRVPARGGKEAELRDVTVLALDKPHDLAVLKLSGAPLPPLGLRDSSSVREGETYSFTGFPIGGILGFSPVTHRAVISSVTPIALPTGTSAQLNEHAVSRLKSGIFPIFQLDATSYPGNSGSPLYDQQSGEVVGIVNMTFVKESRESALTHPTGISFAIPIQHLQELLRRQR